MSIHMVVAHNKLHHGSYSGPIENPRLPVQFKAFFRMVGPAEAIFYGF